MLKHSGLGDGFWAEALLTAVHIINLSPSRPLEDKVPQELWSEKTPDYNRLRIFGCEAYALVPKDDRRKLESRSRKCIFLGYRPDGSFGYRLWDPETSQVIRIAIGQVEKVVWCVLEAIGEVVKKRSKLFSVGNVDGDKAQLYRKH